MVTREKKSELQVGFEPMTPRDLVRCSNHWATGDSMVSKGEVAFTANTVLCVCLGKWPYSSQVKILTVDYTVHISDEILTLPQKGAHGING